MSNDNENAEKHQKFEIPCVVIGGGISGLALTMELCKRGTETILLEKQNYLGGLASSILHEDYKIDIGPHFVALPKKSQITDEVFKIMGDKIIKLPSDIFHTFYKTYFHGKLYNGYPPIYEIIFNFGKINFLKSVTSVFFSNLFSKMKDKKHKNYKDYLVANYGKYLFEKWFKPYLNKKYPNEEPPLKEIQEKFPKINLSKIKKSLNKRKQNETNNEIIEDDLICYFKGGMQSLINQIQKEIENNSGKIKLGVSINEINHNDEQKIITIFDGNIKSQIITKKIVYALPIPLILKWFNNIPNRLNQANLPGIHTIMVFLFIDSPKLYDSWVINFYDDKLIFSRIAQQNFLSDTVCPKNKTLLSIEIRTTSKDHVWELNDNQIFENVKEDLIHIGVLKNEKIDGYKIIRIKNLIPNRHNVNNDKKQEIAKFINSFKNEYAFGTESDSGELASGNAESEKKVMYGGGIFNAFLKSQKLAEKISKDMVYSQKSNLTR